MEAKSPYYELASALCPTNYSHHLDIYSDPTLTSLLLARATTSFSLWNVSMLITGLGVNVSGLNSVGDATGDWSNLPKDFHLYNITTVRCLFYLH